MPLPWKTSIASGVEGMFAPSATALQPLATSILASLPSSSFWVAQGSAISQGMDQTRWFSMYLAPAFCAQ